MAIFMNIQSLLHFPGKQTCWFSSLSSCWRLRKPSLWKGIGSCLPLRLLHAANSSLASFVYTLMQSSTPTSPSHKGDKSFLWQCPPESPSVYAELKDLDFMQMASGFIYLFNILFKRDCPICTVYWWCLEISSRQYLIVIFSAASLLASSRCVKCSAPKPWSCL